MCKGGVILFWVQAQRRVVASVSVKADATLVECGATVVIEQRFTTPHDVQNLKDIEAVYQFPLPENAAVCGFECVFDDGRKIEGIVKEKQEAREDYQAAVNAGKTAALMEQEMPDVFQVSLGNLTGQVLTTRITYVQEFSHNAADEEIRFSILSKDLKDRYGVAPSPNSLSTAHTLTTATASAPVSDEPSVSIALEMPNPILALSSPSHSSMVVKLGRSGRDESVEFDPKRARIELEGKEQYVDRELVVVAKVKDFNKPRCMVERHPVDGTTAVCLTLLPRFALNEIQTELVVLVDRSGSMEGAKIKQASNALAIFLKSIPEGSYFNIIGFGSNHKSLFQRSVEYNQKNLKTAEAYVKALKADMGGTEIQSAVEGAFSVRRGDMPTQLFVITDGEVWNVESLLDSVRRKVEDSEKENGGKAFVRVFSLGIGDDVSHHLVEGIARVGGGFAQFVGSGEKLRAAQVVKMLKAAVLPPVTDYSIDWTDGWKPEDEDYQMVDAPGMAESKPKPAISLFSDSTEPPKPAAPAMPDLKRSVQPAPFVVPKLWPGARFTAYAILDASVPVPTKITVKGTSPDGPMELVIPVTATMVGTTIHTLAARKLIQDITDERSYLPSALKTTGPAPYAVAKAEIVRLGVHYHLASKHTSFVAVDERGIASLEPEVAKVNIDAEEGVYEKMDMFRMSAPAPLMQQSMQIPAAKKSSLGGFRSYLRKYRGGDASAPMMFAAAAPAAPVQSFAFSAAASPPPPPPSCAPGAGAAPEPSFNTSSFTSMASSMPNEQQPLPPQYALSSKMCEEDMLLLDDDFEGVAAPSPAFDGIPPTGGGDDGDESSTMERLISLQKYDGSFDWTEVSRLLSVKDEAMVIKDIDRKTLACALAVVYLQDKFAKFEDEWELVVAKARKFGVGCAGGADRWESALATARSMI